MEQIKMNENQVRNVFKFIHGTQSEEVKESIFGQLGYQCFHASGFDQWLEQYRGKPDEYLDTINNQHSSMYGESLKYSEDGNSLIVTGNIVERCVCSFANGNDATLSLCNYCCKKFNEHFFGVILDRKVTAEISTSFLKGDNRCSTIIHFL